MPGETDLEITLTGSDPDGDSLTYQVSGEPWNGYLTIGDSEDGSVLIYRPHPGFVGEDSFTFQAMTDNAYSSGTVSISVIDSGNGCAQRYDRVSSESNETVQISFTNEGLLNLHIHWISPDGQEGDYSGTPGPVASVGQGQSINLSAYRGFLFVVLDDDDRCHGIAEATEAGNGTRLGDISVTVTTVESYDDNIAEPGVEDGGTFNDQGTVDDDGVEGSSILTPTQIANGCAEHGQIASEDKGRDASMHVTNESSEWLFIYWVNFEGYDTDYAEEGNHNSIDAVAPGCRVDFEGIRGYVFSILDEYNQCVGLLKARESRNGIVLGENGPSACE